MTKLTGILLLFLYTTTVAQTDSSFQLVKTVKGDIVAFTVDNLDNIYLLNSSNQVKKLNANGDSVAIFNDVKKSNVTNFYIFEAFFILLIKFYDNNQLLAN